MISRIPKLVCDLTYTLIGPAVSPVTIGYSSATTLARPLAFIAYIHVSKNPITRFSSKRELY